MPIGDFYGSYHGRFLGLARQSSGDSAEKTQLQGILARFDDDCLRLSPAAAQALRHELATQIEHEILRFLDNHGRAVLALALKHIDEAERFAANDASQADTWPYSSRGFGA